MSWSLDLILNEVEAFGEFMQGEPDMKFKSLEGLCRGEPDVKFKWIFFFFFK